MLRHLAVVVHPSPPSVMRVASWNVNSVKARLDHIRDWLVADSCDVLLLQEIKSQTENFPLDVFAEMGWHAAVHGQKSYNGVAIISRPIEDVGVAYLAIQMMTRRAISRQQSKAPVSLAFIFQTEIQHRVQNLTTN